ncbi:MAG TPA: YihY family inner membrane protein [Ottowia sp.]|uniref:YihY family inner membrane protein n=1 Tax=Ottowia sp. TaxID=1898956 RepID=UPI002C5EEF6B|nr:YihY family inner membrane protein [Ottowia sp.]HRN07204.1 YihY family inner membrane protein [Ottowia sp.]
MKLSGLPARAKTFVTDVTDFPVLPTAATLWERFQQDRLGLTASSLTFTTTLALVPFFAVVLAIFTAFPIFGQLKGALEQWLIDSLIPTSIARNVLDYLTQFATKANELGTVGLLVLLFTALSLVLTIDHTLNDIWRVSVKRPLGQRILVYWAALTLGPLVMGASLAITSYVLTASRGWLPDLADGVNLALDTVQFVLMMLGLTLLYRFVPNTPVKWKHALAGGLFVAVCLALAKQMLGWYLSRIPTYSMIYGAFATVPILLLWIYLSWLIVLFGAVIAAYLPSLLSGVARRGDGPGWHFELAVEALQALARAGQSPRRGLTLPQLAEALRVDSLQLSPVLEALQGMNWVGELATRSDNEQPRYVLLIDPVKEPLQPLAARLLLAPGQAMDAWWRQPGVGAVTVADLLAAPPDSQAKKATSAQPAGGGSS